MEKGEEGGREGGREGGGREERGGREGEEGGGRGRLKALLPTTYPAIQFHAQVMENHVMHAPHDYHDFYIMVFMNS